VVNSVAELSDLMHTCSMEAILQEDLSYSRLEALQESIDRLQHLATQAQQLSSFEISSKETIVVGNSLLEVLHDTVELTQRLNSLQLQLQPSVDCDQTSSRDKHTESEETAARSQLARVFEGLARQLGGESPKAEQPGPPKYLTKHELLGVRQQPESGATEHALNLLRDAHQLWRRLTGTSLENLTQREALRQALPQSVLDVSIAEIMFIQKESEELRKQWRHRSCPSPVGRELALSLLLDNAALRLELNTQQHALHEVELQKLQASAEEHLLEDGSSQDAGAAGSAGSGHVGADMAERFKTLFSFD